MTISNLALRVSRALHQAAVRFHCKALKLSVLAASAKADLLGTEARVAASAALEAHRMASAATDAAIKARDHAYNVRLAAQTEANQLGGSL